MTSPYTYSPPSDDAELSALFELQRRAFNFDADRGERTAAIIGQDRLRALRRDGALVGGMASVPMSQFFGGRSIPTAGYTMLAIDPNERGRGAAHALMTHIIRDDHEQGFPLGLLYPAAQTIYRKTGFEQSGDVWETTLRLREMNIKDRSVDIRPATADDEQAMHALYREDAATHNGMLDRGEFHWARIRTHRNQRAEPYVAIENDAIAGYIYLVRTDSPHATFGLRAVDLTARSSAVARRLLALLGDHRTMAQQAVIQRSPHDPLFGLIPEFCYTSRLHAVWMLRLLHVDKAIEERGYPSSVRTELHIDVQDELFSANHGRFVITVEDGQASIRSGGDGLLIIPIRSFGPLYAGYRSATQLARMDMIEGDAESIRKADSVFAGAAPWMSEMF